MPVDVLHLIDDLTVGGAQRLVVQLSNHAAARGATVVVCARDTGPLWADLDPAVLRLPWRPGRRLADAMALVPRIRRTVQAHAIDVVHVHGRMLAVAANLAVRGLRAVVVEHVHNTFAPTPSARAVAFRSQHLIACGSAVARMLVEDFRRPARRVHLIVNGVPDSGPPRPLPSCGTQGGLRLVAVGALTEQKDPARFLRVVGALHAEGGLRQAIWIGPGDSGFWQAEARLAGLGEVVRFVPPVPDVRQHLDDAHLLLSTSRHEGLPLSALEALCAGRGVVLPDVGSCRDVLAAGPEHGLLYPVGEDDQALARRLAALSAVRAPVGWSPAARAAWQADFTLAAMLQRVDDLYARVVPA